ncbi:MAG: signal peptidase I [Eubacteriales bacterium]|nr:signal peptidase I [Eubacteriales bacterium]
MKKQEAEKKKQPSILMDLEFLFLKIGFIAIVMVLMFTLLFGIVQMPDNTMKPAIKEGDLTIFYRLQKNYVAGDVITVEYKDETQVRRVVAVAGDTVDITADGHLEINGYSQIEDNIYVETLPYKQGIKFPVKVKSGQVFVLADDRNTPIDSRLYGPVDISATHGKVMTIIRRRGI